MSHRCPKSRQNRKLFVGPRFRRIRRQLGLSQTQMAEGLGISPSYVNLIERNQRPVSAQILLRLAETYDLDLRDLAAGEDDRAFAELNEIVSDPLFRALELPKQELRDFAELAPNMAHAMQRLYAAYMEARRGETLAASRFAGRDEAGGYEANPVDRVRDIIEAEPQPFPDAGSRRRKTARRTRRARARTLPRALGALAHAPQHHHARAAGRRHARQSAPLRPPSPPSVDLGTRRWLPAACSRPRFSWR